MSDLSTNQIEVVDQLQTHFDDVAWYIGKYDEAKDPYERLDWLRKTLGRLHPDEIDSLDISRKLDLFRKFSSCAEAIKNAQNPSWIYFPDVFDQPPMRTEWDNYRKFNLPSWVVEFLPGEEWEMTNVRYKHVQGVEPVMREFFKFLLGRESKVTYAFASRPKPCIQARSWSKSSIQLVRAEYFRLKGEFEQNLSSFMDRLVSIIRIELVEPKGIPIKHSRSIKEEKKT